MTEPVLYFNKKKSIACIIALAFSGCGGGISDRNSRTSTESSSSSAPEIIPDFLDKKSSDNSLIEPEASKIVVETPANNFGPGVPTSRAIEVRWESAWSEKFEKLCKDKFDCSVDIWLNEKAKIFFSEIINPEVFIGLRNKGEGKSWRSRYSAQQSLVGIGGRRVRVTQFWVYKFDENNCVVSSLVIVPMSVHESFVGNSLINLLKNEFVQTPIVKVSQSLVEIDPGDTFGKIANNYARAEIFSKRIFANLNLFLCPNEAGNLSLKSEAIISSAWNRN